MMCKQTKRHASALGNFFECRFGKAIFAKQLFCRFEQRFLFCHTDRRMTEMLIVHATFFAPETEKKQVLQLAAHGKMPELPIRVL